MTQATEQPATDRTGQIVDFDEVLLDACTPEAFCEVMAEANLIADAFAPERRAAEVAALAKSLQSGVRDLEMGRAHALLLAAALRRLAHRGIA